MVTWIAETDSGTYESDSVAVIIEKMAENHMFEEYDTHVANINELFCFNHKTGRELHADKGTIWKVQCKADDTLKAYRAEYEGWRDCVNDNYCGGYYV